MTGRRPLGGLDPRVKLGWGLVQALAGLVFTDLRTVAVLLISIVLVAAADGRLGLLRRQRRLMATVVALGLGWGVLLPGQPVLELPVGLVVSAEGVLFGLVWAGRVLIAVVPLLLVVQTTRPLDLVQALVALGLRPSWALAIARALMVPPFAAAAMARLNPARKARASPLAGSGLLDRPRGLVALSRMALQRALARARDVGARLERRGSAGRWPEPAFAPLSPGSYVLLAFSAALLLLAVASLVANRDLLADLVTGTW